MMDLLCISHSSGSRGRKSSAVQSGGFLQSFFESCRACRSSLSGVWIGGVWNGHDFQSLRKYSSEAEICKKTPHRERERERDTERHGERERERERTRQREREREREQDRERERERDLRQISSDSPHTSTEIPPSLGLMKPEQVSCACRSVW